MALGGKMDTSIVFNQVLVLFLIMIVGVIARKRNIINREVNKKLTELLLNVTLPMLIITSFQFQFSAQMLLNAGIFFVASTGVLLLSVLISKLIFTKFPCKTKSVLKFVTVFSNCGFMGFPILEALYGKTGIFYGSIFSIPFNLLLWTYGVVVFNGEKNIKTVKKAFTNPGIVAVLIGIILYILSVKLPYAVYTAMSMVGTMTSPLSMIIIGGILAEVHLKDMFSGVQVYYGALLRLIALPLITFAALRFLKLEYILSNILVVITAMPAAANTALFANMFEGDTLLASRLVGISTLLSVITLPLIIILIGV